MIEYLVVLNMHTSRVLLKLFFYISMVLVFTSCGLNLGEPEPKIPVAKIQSTECLTPSIDKLKLFFEGEASGDQVGSSVDCLQDVLKAFKENIRGENRDLYTPREIADFIESNFLKNEKTFSDSFLFELMQFKMALFGGSSQFVHRREVEVAASFLKELQEPLVKLNPYMKMITMNKKHQGYFDSLSVEEREDFFAQSKIQFSLFVKVLSGKFSNSQAPYKINNLVNFILEVCRFVEVEDGTIQTISSTKSFIKKIKHYLVGGEEAILGEEWDQVGSIATEIYFEVLRYHYFILPLQDQHQAEKWLYYEKMTTDLTELLQSLLQKKKSGVLTQSELYDLFSSVEEFLPAFKINAGVIEDVTNLKIMLIESGDNTLVWSADDLSKLKIKYSAIFNFIRSLIAHSDILISQSKVKSITYFDFLNAETQITESSLKLTKQISGSYSIEKFKKLALNLSENLFKNQFKLPDNFNELIDLTHAVQPVLVGHENTDLSKEDLNLVITTGIRTYLHYREFELFIKNEKLEQISFITGIEAIWPKVVKTIEYVLVNKKSHQIVSTELIQPILVAQNKNLLKTHLREVSLNNAFESLWNHLLIEPKRRIDGNLNESFNLNVLKFLKNEVDYYIIAQKQINLIFDKQQTLTSEQLNFELKEKLKDILYYQKPAVGLQELIGLTDSKYAMNFNESSLLKILTPDNGVYHFKDLFFSNISRAISRLAIGGYATDLSRAESLLGINSEEAHLAYKQLKPLAVDFDFLEESNNTFIDSRFREANLFLSVSDGDDLVNLSEFHQIILHIISGINRATFIKEDISKYINASSTTCSAVLSPEGNLKSVDEACLLDVYVKNETAFADLPELLKFKLAPETDFKIYSLGLLKAIGYVSNESHQVLVTDFDLLPHLAQYIEMIYSRHDQNRNGFLEKDEALLAFPVFKNLLKDLVKPYKQIKEEDLPGVFIYILKYGRPPKKESIKEVLQFVAFIRDKDKKGWDIQTNRTDLGKILNYIAEATQPPVTP